MNSRRVSMTEKICMALIDAACLVLAGYLVLNTTSIHGNFMIWCDIMPFIISCTILFFNVNGLYNAIYKPFIEVVLGIIASVACVFLLAIFISGILIEPYDARIISSATLASYLPLIIVCRYVIWNVEKKIHLRKRDVLIFGSEEECKRIYSRIVSQEYLMLKLKAICTDPINSEWRNAIDSVDTVIVCSDVRLKYKSKIVRYCKSVKKTAIVVPSVYEVFTGEAEMLKIEDVPIFRFKKLRLSMEHRILKRGLDLSISSIAFLCALPLMIVTAIAIKIGDPGPILYSQVRVGRYGREFKIYKFRTMRVDAEKYSGPMMATDHDPRITKLGRFLRSVRLDELPQIWNVVCGDMSIVGPRPERPFFVSKFEEEIPEYKYRHNIKPGITGMAQVYGKYNTTAYDKLVYDLMYIQKYSILEDFVIILRTVKVLFTKSATEGVGASKENINLYEIDISVNNCVK